MDNNIILANDTQIKTDFNKTAIAITSIIAITIITIKYVDAKYHHETVFSFDRDKTHIYFNSHTCKPLHHNVEPK